MSPFKGDEIEILDTTLSVVPRISLEIGQLFLQADFQIEKKLQIL